ncbi:hypothetical protein K0M31_002430, partial [Melipona bicolor]
INSALMLQHQNPITHLHRHIHYLQTVDNLPRLPAALSWKISAESIVAGPIEETLPGRVQPVTRTESIGGNGDTRV